MAKQPAPHTVIRARDITGEWPARADKTRSEPDKVYRVVDGEQLSKLARDPRAVNGLHVPWDQLISRVTTATLYSRYTRSNTCHVVCLYHGAPEDPIRVFYGWASGYGYDKFAAACSGMPLAPGVIATDHCGMDRFPDHGVVDSDGRALRSVLVDRGSRSLPAGLFVL